MLKRLGNWVTALFKLHQTEWRAKTVERSLASVEAAVATTQADKAASAAQIATLTEQLAHLTDRLSAAENRGAATDARLETTLATLHRTQQDWSALHYGLTQLSTRLDRFMQGDPPHTTPPPQPSEMTVGARDFLDQVELTLALRDSPPAARRAQLRTYLPDVEAAVMRALSKPVLDLRAGRGDWLAVLTDEGLDASGVDDRTAVAAAAKDKGLPVRQGMPVAELRAAEDNSLSVITGFFDTGAPPLPTLVELVREASRVLAPGGLLLMELSRDHTQTLTALPIILETAGFNPIEVKPLAPNENLSGSLQDPDVSDDIAMRLLGPERAAVFGTKRGVPV